MRAYGSTITEPQSAVVVHAEIGDDQCACGCVRVVETVTLTSALQMQRVKVCALCGAVGRG